MWTKIFVLVGMGLILGACGKVSKPIAPEDSPYPRTYAVTQE